MNQPKQMGDGEYIARTYFKDALGYVRDVLGVKEVEPWQKDVLADCSNGVQRIAVGSGHGIGKTALTAWVTHWFNATRPNPQGIVTANTNVAHEGTARRIQDLVAAGAETTRVAEAKVLDAKDVLSRVASAGHAGRVTSLREPIRA